jgi:hypothetical protein
VRHLAGQAVSVVAELGAGGVIGAAPWLATGWPLLTACGTAALVYYPIATVLTGRVLSPAHLGGILKVHPAGTSSEAAEPAAEPAALYLVPRTSAPPAIDFNVSADEFPQPRTAAR